MRPLLLACLLPACASAPPVETLTVESPMPTRSPRSVHKEVIVHTTPELAFRALSTSEGLEEVLGVPANVRAEPGGPYEIFWVPDAPAGQRGTEGCTVIEVDPPRTIAFTWNNPPMLAAIREQLTRVTVRIDPLAGGDVRIRLEHDGFGDGADWDAALRYFDRAWEVVTAALRKRFPPP